MGPIKGWETKTVVMTDQRVGGEGKERERRGDGKGTTIWEKRPDGIRWLVTGLHPPLRREDEVKRSFPDA